MHRRSRLDRELARYLVHGERVVTAVRKHWFSLARPTIAAAASLLFALWVDTHAAATAFGRASTNVAWLGWWICGGWLLWRYLNWRRDWFVATDKRFLLFYGFIRRKVAMMPNVKVTDMTFDRSVMGRVLGYGNFILESAGFEQALSHIDYVPDSDEHYRRICSVLFGTLDEQLEYDDESDGPWGRDDPRGWDGRGGPGGRGDGGGTGSLPPSFPGPYAVDAPSRDGARSEGREESGHGPHHPRHASSIYRSPDLERVDRTADTGEIPVLPGRSRPAGRAEAARPEPVRSEWYVPEDWTR